MNLPTLRIDSDHFRNGSVAIHQIIPRAEAEAFPEGIARFVSFEHHQRAFADSQLFQRLHGGLTN